MTTTCVDADLVQGDGPEDRGIALGLAVRAGLALRATVVGVSADGSVVVRCGEGDDCACDFLQTGPQPALQAGDEVLLVRPANHHQRGVVLGRIGPLLPPAMPTRLQLCAAESLSLQCGASSLELRANGQVLLKGDDVVIRAKGTQRIRAGNVAIN